MFGADPKFSKEPATKAFRSLLSGREATACYAAAQTHTRRAESAGFTMRHLTNRLRESLNLRGLQCATSRTAENLNLPEPVHYATQKRRPSPRRGSSLHCSLPRSSVPAAEGAQYCFRTPPTHALARAVTYTALEQVYGPKRGPSRIFVNANCTLSPRFLFFLNHDKILGQFQTHV